MVAWFVFIPYYFSSVHTFVCVDVFRYPLGRNCKHWPLSVALTEEVKWYMVEAAEDATNWALGVAVIKWSNQKTRHEPHMSLSQEFAFKLINLGSRIHSCDEPIIDINFKNPYRSNAWTSRRYNLFLTTSEIELYESTSVSYSYNWTKILFWRCVPDPCYNT